MNTYKLSKQLHKPALIVALELPEICLFFMCYGMAMLGGGFWWLVLLSPFAIIPWMRKQPRGFVTHSLCTVGISKIEGFPLLITREFHQ